MEISEFIKKYNNHPVLFVGTGISLRYYNNSSSWDDLLCNTIVRIGKSKENYYDIKSKNYINKEYDFPKIGSDVEKLFNEHLEQNRDREFKSINDEFYKSMAKIDGLVDLNYT